MEETTKKIQKPSKLKKLIANADIFSAQTSFYFQRKQSFSTIFGGISSIIILIFCIYLSFTNQSFYQNGIDIVSISQEFANFQFSFNRNNYPIGISLSNSNFGSIFGYDNFTVTFSCVHQDSNKNILSSTVIGTSRNCGKFGQYCIANDIECNFYQLATTETQFVTVNINICNSTNPNCNLSFINQYFNETYFTLIYQNYEPNADTMQWVTTLRRQTTHMFINYTIEQDIIFTKQIFVTNNPFFGSIGLFSTNLYSLKQRSEDLPTTEITPGVIGYNSNFIQFNLQTSNSIYTLNQQFFNLSGLITYYFSIYGVLVVVIGLILNNYSNNLLFLSLARYFRYALDQKNQIINFHQLNFKTFLFCILYFQVIPFYPQCFKQYFKYHISMREFGNEKLKIHTFLKDIYQLNVEENTMNQIVKIDLGQKNQQDSLIQQKNKLQIKQKLRQIFQNNTILRGVTDKEIQIFIKWTQLNQYGIQWAHKLIEIIYLNINTNIYCQNIKKQYNNFKTLCMQAYMEDDIHCGFDKDYEISDIKLLNINKKDESSSNIVRQIRFKKSNLNKLNYRETNMVSVPEYVEQIKS